MKCNRRKKSLIVICSLLMINLTACTNEKSVVTSDNLQPSSNVQVALEQQAGGGKTYQYIWLAQDPDTTIENYRISYEKQLEKMLQETNSSDLSTQTSYETYEQAMEEELSYYRKELEKERSLDPVITSQEAANISGRILEENYGLDLTQRTLYLSCSKAEVGGTERLQWYIHLYEDEDGILFSSAESNIVLDATTGEIVTAEYTPSYEEYQTTLEHLPSCYEPTGDPDATGSYGFYKVDDPSFAEFQKTVSEQIRAALDQSALAAGASVNSVEVRVTDGAVKNEYLTVSIGYDNGNTALLTALKPYSCDENFPLRRFQYGNTAYCNSQG